MKVLLGKGGASAAGWHKIEKILLCETEYKLAVVRGIRRPQEYNPDHFSVGSIFHAGRARWFSLKFSTSASSWQKIRDACDQEAQEMQLPVTFKASKQALVYLTEYIEHYRMLPKPRPIAAEYLLGPCKLRPSDPLYMFRTARLDDVSYYDEAAGQLCIGESKTTGSSIGDTVLQYQLHGQPILQYMLWKAAEQGEKTWGPVAGTILDITQKGYGGKKCKFSRVFIPFEQRVLDWFHKTMTHYLKRASEITWNSDTIHNIAACTRMGGRGRVACDFQSLCVGGRSATINYVQADGSSLTRFKPTDERWVRPWET